MSQDSKSPQTPTSGPELFAGGQATATPRPKWPFVVIVGMFLIALVVFYHIYYGASSLP